jgi:hypothetical protein
MSMARWHELDARKPGWRDLAWATVAAAAITLLLVASIAVVWLVDRAPATQPPAPALAGDTFTPTPRALSFVHATTTPAPAAAPTDAADNSIVITGAATPELLSVVSEDGARSGAGSGRAPAVGSAMFAAPGNAALATLAAGSWQAEDGVLRNTGETAAAEPWLTLTTVPSPTFAVEAEIRVTGQLPAVCDQSFGLVGGSPAAQAVYGAGLIFPCQGGGTVARLTDAGDWADGYNADPVMANAAFDPGTGWHTYRFEVRGDQLRLLVDGVAVVSGAAEAPLDAQVSDAEAGLWSQGVGIEIRQVAVYQLPQ